MAKNNYLAYGLIGGATGALDAIDGTDLADQDMAFVSVQDGFVYHYVLDADSGAAESSPDIISPDSNAGTKRWILHNIYGVVLEVDFNANTILAATADNTPVTLTVGEQTLIGRITSGNIAALTPAQIRVLINVEDGADVTGADNVNSAGAVMESDYNANTVLAATSDNTPVTLTVGEQTLVGRITSGNIVALTPTQIRTLINVENGADVTDATNVAAAGAVMASLADAKGDIFVATADNTVTRLAVGSNSDVLTANSGEASGLEWAAAGAPGAHNLGGASHNADSLADLNSKVNDATLVDTGDMILKAFMAAKGDIISASADDTPLILSVGTDTYRLVADSNEAIGLKWEAIPSASTGQAGQVELATTAETDTGTDATRAVTPDGLAGSLYGTKVVSLKPIDTDTALTTGDDKMRWVVPVELNGMNLVSVGAHVFTASSSGTPTVQIHNLTDTVDMLSTEITIDANEKDSATANTPPVIDAGNDDVATGDEIRIDVDVAGTGTEGLEVRLGFRTP